MVGKSNAEQPLRVTWEQIGERVVIGRLSGELELYTVAELRRQAERLALERMGRVVLDLSNVTFIDSAGLSALIWLFRRIGVPGTLRLVDATARHASMFRIAQLARVMPVYPHVDQALAAA
jgi:anti-sigma B factor antagonist